MSTPTSTRSWILANRPRDLPIVDDSDEATFKLVSRELAPLGADQVLLQTLYMSNDPAQRGWISDIKADRLYTAPVELGSPMRTLAIGKVIKSQSDKLAEGQFVTAWVGWSEYTVLNATACNPISQLPGGLSLTHYLGALGPTGLTAWYGLRVIAEAKPDDVVVVSGAAGATGSMVVQIAKRIVGCKKVIGIAGGADKCRWVESELGADLCLDYKAADFESKLIEATGTFVDVYFDNVGGDVLSLMITRMAKFGRIAACGAISEYNSSQPKGVRNWTEIITMRVQIRGFLITDYLPHFGEVVAALRKGIEEGKLRVSEKNEHVVDTKFEDVPKTWIKLFEGANTGKLVTKIV